MRLEATRQQSQTRSQHKWNLVVYIWICCATAIKESLRAVRHQLANLYAGIGSLHTRVSSICTVVNELIVEQMTVRQRNLHCLGSTIDYLGFRKTEDSLQRRKGNSVFNLYSSKMSMCVVGYFLA
jgi:hypothetical protein